MAKKPKAVPTAPYLSVGLMCEKVLREVDGPVTPVRIVDRITIPIMGNIPDGAIIKMPYALLFIVRCGTFVGEKEIKIVAVTPSVKKFQISRAELAFDGHPEGGATIECQVAFQWEANGGLYWFEAHVDGVVIGRVPMKLTVTPASPGASAEPQPIKIGKK